MSKMKNFMDFKTFSVSESYYNDFSYLGKDRKTELGKKLEKIRGRVDDEFKTEDTYGEKSWRSSKRDAVSWLAGAAISGLLDIGAAAADLFGKSKEDKKRLKDEDPEKSFNAWKENLGSTSTEKDLETFAKKSEETAFKRYGKSWDYDNPKGEEQEKFADMIKRGENELVKRMKRK